MWERFELKAEDVLDLTTRRIDWMIKGFNNYNTESKKQGKEQSKELPKRTRNANNVLDSIRAKEGNSNG